ncbi:hypothetical protein KY290_007873 [Solanum tuberosum]|uniref:Uncharacterized protein n=1 Tax=Solanum tuberosum TaxID=4113 RepID=A0ABQ7W9J5_SOLTU|nr:hypothetical protein KY290_007873 [Solanum tuberosum]
MDPPSRRGRKGRTQGGRGGHILAQHGNKQLVAANSVASTSCINTDHPMYKGFMDFMKSKKESDNNPPAYSTVLMDEENTKDETVMAPPSRRGRKGRTQGGKGGHIPAQHGNKHLVAANSIASTSGINTDHPMYKEFRDFMKSKKESDNNPPAYSTVIIDEENREVFDLNDRREAIGKSVQIQDETVMAPPSRRGRKGRTQGGRGGHILAQHGNKQLVVANNIASTCCINTDHPMYEEFMDFMKSKKESDNNPPAYSTILMTKKTRKMKPSWPPSSRRGRKGRTQGGRGGHILAQHGNKQLVATNSIASTSGINTDHPMYKEFIDFMKSKKESDNNPPAYSTVFMDEENTKDETVNDPPSRRGRQGRTQGGRGGHILAQHGNKQLVATNSIASTSCINTDHPMYKEFMDFMRSKKESDNNPPAYSTVLMDEENTEVMRPSWPPLREGEEKVEHKEDEEDETVMAPPSRRGRKGRTQGGRGGHILAQNGNKQLVAANSIASTSGINTDHPMYKEFMDFMKSKKESNNNPPAYSTVLIDEENMEVFDLNDRREAIVKSVLKFQGDLYNQKLLMKTDCQDETVMAPPSRRGRKGRTQGGRGGHILAQHGNKQLVAANSIASRNGINTDHPTYKEFMDFMKSKKESDNNPPADSTVLMDEENMEVFDLNDKREVILPLENSDLKWKNDPWQILAPEEWGMSPLKEKIISTLNKRSR